MITMPIIDKRVAQIISHVGFAVIAVAKRFIPKIKNNIPKYMRNDVCLSFVLAFIIKFYFSANKSLRFSIIIALSDSRSQISG